jgi:hypothetical protein
MPIDESIAITSVDDALIELGLPESEFARIERLVNAASARLETFCGTVFKKRTVTKTITGGDHVLLDLGAPIISVDYVKIAGVALGAADYKVLNRRGELYRDGGWATYSALAGTSTGVGNVEVKAALGYDPIPYEIQEACMQLVRYWKENAGRFGLASERVTEYSYQRAATSGDIPEEIREMVLPFRRW